MPLKHGEIALLLAGLAALLAAARVLGEIARRLRQPPLTGELAAGVLLGPTVLGRVAPDAWAPLFGPGTPVLTVIYGVAWLGVIFVLLEAGLEVDLARMRRLGRAALVTSAAGIAGPFAAGAALALAIGAEHFPGAPSRAAAAVLLGAALSISALPVIARLLAHYDLVRTDVGGVILAAAMIDDLLGWILFSTVLGWFGGEALSAARVARSVLVTLGLAIFFLGPARALARRAVPRVEAHASAAATVTLCTASALAGAAIAEACGTHAVFGAFLAGIAVAGGEPRKEVREAIRLVAASILAPIFFASVGLRADFAAAFDAPLVAAVIAVACAGKIVGGYAGARAGGLAHEAAVPVALGLNARGAMEVILALAAWQAGMIGERLFVAMIVMALATTALAGPGLARYARNSR